MAITRNDVDEVFGPDGQVIDTAQVVRDVTRSTNGKTIEQQARQALTANRTFLALTTPNNAQAIAQVQALTRQTNGIIRLLLNELDGTD